MITIERRLPVNDAGDPAGPAYSDGRLLALRCLASPRWPPGRQGAGAALMRSLAAFCARIRPCNTAELASLVLYLAEEIDRRDRMLDAAPGYGNRARRADPWQLGSIPAAGQGGAAATDLRACHRMTPWPSGNDPARAGSREATRSRRRHGRLRRPGRPGLEPILDHVSWLRRSSRGSNSLKNPALIRDC